MKYRVFKKYNIVYGEGIATPVGRFSWPYLTQKKDAMKPTDGSQPGEAKHEITLMLPKKSKEVKAFIKALETHASEMLPYFNEGAKNEIAKVKRIVRDGDASDGEKYPNDAGHWLLTARNKELPVILNEKKKALDPKELIGGMLGKLVVVPLLANGGFGFKLEAVQFIEDDGTRFGGTKEDYSSLLDGLDDDEDAEEIEEEEDSDTPEDSEDEDTSDEDDEEEGEDESEEEDSDDEEEEEDPAPPPAKTKLSAAQRAQLAATEKAKAQKSKVTAGKGKASAVNLL